ncbi:MAG: GIY-YIG nuclease family protein [Candidatus Omnitrophota bacterium]
MRKRRLWVYIVECRDKTLYTGYTTDLPGRITAHNSGRGAKYTRQRRPVKLVWSREYNRLTDALKAEKAVQSLTRKDKQLLVSGVSPEKGSREYLKR